MRTRNLREKTWNTQISNLWKAATSFLQQIVGAVLVILRQDCTFAA